MMAISTISVCRIRFDRYISQSNRFGAVWGIRKLREWLVKRVYWEHELRIIGTVGPSVSWMLISTSLDVRLGAYMEDLLP